MWQKNLDNATHGLIFGANTFFALILQSVLTSLVVNWFSILFENYSIFNQFSIYAVLQAGLAGVFLIIGIWTCNRKQSYKDPSAVKADSIDCSAS